MTKPNGGKHSNSALWRNYFKEDWSSIYSCSSINSFQTVHSYIMLDWLHLWYRTPVVTCQFNWWTLTKMLKYSICRYTIWFICNTEFLFTGVNRECPSRKSFMFHAWCNNHRSYTTITYVISVPRILSATKQKFLIPSVYRNT